MTLSEWAAERKKELYQALSKKNEPPDGEYDESILREAFDKGPVQMGTTVFEQDCALFEFIFPDSNSTSTVLSVKLAAPERIVFLPVPPWVVETIWQGDIDGTHHFESEAMRLVKGFAEELGPEANRKWFGPRQAKRRE